MEIIGDNIILREIQEEDTDYIVKWRNQESIKKFFIGQEDFTREGHLNWYHNVVQTKKAVQFIIIDRLSNKPVGSTFIKDIDYKFKKGEFGIFIGEEGYLGRGIGTEAAKLIIQYGFKELGLHKIFLRVFADNTRAIKSYEKVGYVKEGYFKDDVFIQGKYHDMVYMAVINPYD